MKIAGVVAEYNPFHNGHKYHLEQTRLAGATHIVAVMSGTAVQRGDIAIYDKYTRANAALKNGADLVIELPCPYSVSSAEIFANSAVKLLAGLGENAVNMLSFGCEANELDSLEAAADISERLENSDKVKHLMARGISYPSAIAAAAAELGADDTLAQPNNLLAVEYIKALRKYAPWVKPCSVKRIGAAHDSETASQGTASASKIRALIATGEDISCFVPEVINREPFLLGNADKAVLLKLMNYEGELSEFTDVSPALAQRFFNIRDRRCDEIHSVNDFAALLKNKSITMARVRRVIMHIALGIRADDLFDPPYGRILGLNDRGREILSACKVKTLVYDTSLARLEVLSPNAARISQLEQGAVRLQQLCVKGAPAFVNEYTRKIGILR